MQHINTYPQFIKWAVTYSRTLNNYSLRLTAQQKQSSHTVTSCLGNGYSESLRGLALPGCLVDMWVRQKCPPRPTGLAGLLCNSVRVVVSCQSRPPFAARCLPASVRYPPPSHLPASVRHPPLYVTRLYTLPASVPYPPLCVTRLRVVCPPLCVTCPPSEAGRARRPPSPALTRPGRVGGRK